MPELGLMILRAGIGIVPYGLMAFMLSVVARSTTLGLVGVIIFLFGEAIFIAIMESLGGVWADLRDISIGDNAASLWPPTASAPATTTTSRCATARWRPSCPDIWTACLVLAVYCAIFIAVSYYVFQRRDLKA